MSKNSLRSSVVCHPQRKMAPRLGAPALSRNASARPRHLFDDELVLDGRRCAQPPRPPRPSLSICCHHSDDPKAAAWALDVSAEIAIHVAIRHNVTFLMTCLILLSRCSRQCSQRRGKRTPALTRYLPMATIQASKWWSTTWRGQPLNWTLNLRAK